MKTVLAVLFTLGSLLARGTAHASAIKTSAAHSRANRTTPNAVRRTPTNGGHAPQAPRSAGAKAPASPDTKGKAMAGAIALQPTALGNARHRGANPAVVGGNATGGHRGNGAISGTGMYRR